MICSMVTNWLSDWLVTWLHLWFKPVSFLKNSKKRSLNTCRLPCGRLVKPKRPWHPKEQSALATTLFSYKTGVAFGSQKIPGIQWRPPATSDYTWTNNTQWTYAESGTNSICRYANMRSHFLLLQSLRIQNVHAHMFTNTGEYNIYMCVYMYKLVKTQPSELSILVVF